MMALSEAERDELALRLQADVRERFDIGVVCRRYEAEYRALAAG